MDTLKLGARLATREPVVALDPGLPVGTYRVGLVVEDDRGRRSAGAVLTLHVVRRPTVLPGALPRPLRPPR